MKGCPCCEGRLPDKQPDLTFEEIERDYARQMSEEGQRAIKEWLESRPLKVRELAEKFVKYPAWRVKEGNPYRFTPAGCVVAFHKVVEKDNALGAYDVEAWFHVIRNPDGYAQLVTPFDEEWLEPLTIEQIREIYKEEVN